MSISITCAGCGRQYSVSDKYAGRSGKCKDCGTPFTIPQAPAAPTPNAAAQSSAQPTPPREIRQSITPPPLTISTPAAPPTPIHYASPAPLKTNSNPLKTKSGLWALPIAFGTYFLISERARTGPATLTLDLGMIVGGIIGLTITAWLQHRKQQKQLAAGADSAFPPPATMIPPATHPDFIQPPQSPAQIYAPPAPMPLQYSVPAAATMPIGVPHGYIPQEPYSFPRIAGMISALSPILAIFFGAIVGAAVTPGQRLSPLIALLAIVGIVIILGGLTMGILALCLRKGRRGVLGWAVTGVCINSFLTLTNTYSFFHAYNLSRARAAMLAAQQQAVQQQGGQQISASPGAPSAPAPTMTVTDMPSAKAALQSTNPADQDAAAAFLATAGPLPPDIRRILRGLLTTQDSERRKNFVTLFCRDAQAADVPVLASICGDMNDKSEAVKPAFAQLLALDTDKARAIWEERSGETRFQMGASQSLAALGAQRETVCIALLSSDNKQVLTAVLRFLRRNGTAQCLPALQAAQARPAAMAAAGILINNTVKDVTKRTGTTQ